MGRDLHAGHPSPARLAALLLALGPLAAMGCRQPVASLGVGPQEAQANADGLLQALESRFGHLERDASFESVRGRLSRAALVPSRLYKDPTAWTAVNGPLRTMEFAGSRAGSRYRISVRGGVATPGEPGAYRGVLRLSSVRAGEYEWTMRDELAVGRVRAEELSQALTALLVSAAPGPEESAMASLRRELPRTAAALGRLYSLRAVRLAPSAQGGTTVLLAAGLDPAGVKSEFPRYARYLQKYFVPMLLSLNASDDTGAPWWEIRVREGQATLRCRVHDGNLAPLQGPVRRIPDTLRVRGDFSVKAGLFRVGARQLDAEVQLVREPRRKSFLARFRREPVWEMPLFIEPLLRAPLRRPFEEEGASLGFGVRDDDGPQTLITRDFRIAVKESWIVRWLGGLSSDATSEFQQAAEQEADRFNGEALAALRADTLGLLSAPRPHEAARAAPSQP